MPYCAKCGAVTYPAAGRCGACGENPRLAGIHELETPLSQPKILVLLNRVMPWVIGVLLCVALLGVISYLAKA